MGVNAREGSLQVLDIYKGGLENCVVSHIQRIGCQPEKHYFFLNGGQSRSCSAEQGKKGKKKSLAAHPPPSLHAARSEKKNISRDASTCLGATQVGITQVSVRLAS